MLSEKLNEGHELPKTFKKKDVKFKINAKTINEVSYISNDRKVPTYL